MRGKLKTRENGLQALQLLGRHPEQIGSRELAIGPATWRLIGQWRCSLH